MQARILEVQGFSSKLDQYKIVNEIKEGQNNQVLLAFLKKTGGRVAIKAIAVGKYNQLKLRNGISES